MKRDGPDMLLVQMLVDFQVVSVRIRTGTERLMEGRQFLTCDHDNGSLYFSDLTNSFVLHNVLIPPDQK
jgi:hypothetical protein